MSILNYLDKVNKQNIKMGLFRLLEKREQQLAYINWKKSKNKRGYSANYSYTPLISIVIPVFNVEDKWLTECIESVKNQTYTNWELCIADDASTFANVRPTLTSYSESDERIKVVFREKNGRICQATKSAMAMASGEFVAFVDNDDLLATDALAAIVSSLNDNPSYDYLYTDEDKIDGNLTRDPAFKPDWSPQLSLSTNYTSHLSVYRRTVLKSVEGFSDTYIGSQDYDLMLRVTEKIPSENICHISDILYHWRQLPSSTAGNLASKKYTNEAGKKALAAALKRRDISGSVENGFASGFFEINYSSVTAKKVSIIYAVLNDTASVADELERILNFNNNIEVEIILVVPKSLGSKIAGLEALSKGDFNSKLKVYEQENQRLLSMYNFGAQMATSEFLLFLNNTVSVPMENWLQKWIGIYQRRSVGTVSGTIVDTHENILASGAYLKENFTLQPLNQGKKSFSKGYFGRLRIPTNVSIGEANCFLISKKKFFRLNGFNLNLCETDSMVEFFLANLMDRFENINVPLAHFATTDKFRYIEKSICDNAYFRSAQEYFRNDKFRNNEFPL